MNASTYRRVRQLRVGNGAGPRDPNAGGTKWIFRGRQDRHQSVLLAGSLVPALNAHGRPS